MVILRKFMETIFDFLFIFTCDYGFARERMENCQGLKGKFSSGIEGALASTFNHDFNWKQLSEMILFLLFTENKNLFFVVFY